MSPEDRVRDEFNRHPAENLFIAATQKLPREPKRSRGNFVLFATSILSRYLYCLMVKNRHGEVFMDNLQTVYLSRENIMSLSVRIEFCLKPAAFVRFLQPLVIF